MVQGLDRLKARFDAIPVAVRAAAMKSMEASADEIVATMKSFAPRDKGDVVASINWTWGDAPAGTMTIGKVGDNSFGSLRITIFAGGGKAFHARFQEFGTVNMPAHPFFFPAWRLKKKKFRSSLSRAINKAIRSA